MLFFPVEWGGGVFRKVFFLVGGVFWMVMFLGGVFLGGGVFGWWLCFGVMATLNWDTCTITIIWDQNTIGEPIIPKVQNNAI